MIGRNSEVKVLNHLYSSGRAELVAVYGRCRVGKTFWLMKHFLTGLHSGMQVCHRTLKNPKVFYRHS